LVVVGLVVLEEDGEGGRRGYMTLLGMAGQPRTGYIRME